MEYNSDLVKISGVENWWEWKGFGQHSISTELFYFMLVNFDRESILLELGSGRTTELFSDMYKKVYSIEDSNAWVNKFHSNYIHSPIIYGSDSYKKSLLKIGKYNKGWYDTQYLEKELEKYNDYDLILIDGPSGTIGRYGFSIHIDIFKVDVPMIFDDVNRFQDMANFKNALNKLNKTGRVFVCSDNKAFGVINWENLPNIEIFSELEVMEK
tara:strand:- start:174 stop:809 length:636 start_codon:yes stop_codon:yes gene_type:complete